MSQPGQELFVPGRGAVGGVYFSCLQLGYVSPLLQMKPYVEFNILVLGKEVFIRCKLKSLYITHYR